MAKHTYPYTRYTGRYLVTGEQIGLPQHTQRAVISILKREGYDLSRCVIEQWQWVAQGELPKLVGKEVIHG